MEGALWLLVVVVLTVVVAPAESAGDMKIWPMPASDGFYRMLAVVNNGHVVDGNFSDKSSLLSGLHVVISSPNDLLQYGIDESYKLMVPSPENPAYAHLQANTVYGALHGLQTFSQLCHFNYKSRVIEVHMSPWIITDQPRFSYRGLLIDTCRHYLPLSVIKNVIDSMTYAKLGCNTIPTIMYFYFLYHAQHPFALCILNTYGIAFNFLYFENVLHWHIVDTQSFPLEIPSYPKLWNGAYSASERYTIADAAEIVSYAHIRGINVMAELDVPGHALSWGVGYPALWPSNDCQQPLDVSNEFTFQVIDGILSDFSKIFKFKFVHLGGDEVNTSCWTDTPRIRKWLKKHHMNESQAYQYFVLRAQKIALSHGYEIVNWEETFNNFGNKLSRKTVVHNWLGGGVAEQVVASGLRCIVSNQDKWFLDHLDTTWQEFYMNEPLTNITNSKQQKLVIGGEVCMWGEQIDGSDIEQTIWPRAAAAAATYWLLSLTFGVAAAPLMGPGRVAPIEPGSCYMQ
ncbi:hypothetical protein SLE2022_060190 [Rubroshorea leprosula]